MPANKYKKPEPKVKNKRFNLYLPASVVDFFESRNYNILSLARMLVTDHYVKLKTLHGDELDKYAVKVLRKDLNTNLVDNSGLYDKDTQDFYIVGLS